MKGRTWFAVVLGLLLLIGLAAWGEAAEVLSYKSLSGVVWHQQDLYVTIRSFTDRWGNIVGKKWFMTMTVENRGEDPATFNASQIEIDNGKGTRFYAKPFPDAPPSEMKQTIPPKGTAEFRVMFDGHIFFDRRNPAHLKYTLDTKVDIVK